MLLHPENCNLCAKNESFALYAMRKSIVLLLLLAVFSCKKEEKQVIFTKLKPQLSVVQKHAIHVSIESVSKKEIATWKEYSSLDSFLKQFTAISANEALNNALELADLIKNLKDSIRPKALVNPAFRTRIHVLENEVLRLKDMTYISAITANEVNNQVTKIIEAFAATNSKINTVYSQIELEKKIHNTISTPDLETPQLNQLKKQEKLKEVAPLRKKQK